MKTKDNAQKTIFKSMGVIASLVLINLTVNAQYYWKSLFENYDFNEIELALIDNTVANSEGVDVDFYTSLLKQEPEEALELENWMIDGNYFTASYSIIEEVETPLNVEDWMTNETLFNSNSIYLEAETEEAMELEDWMTEENRFEGFVYQVNEETEIELKIEGWMLNESSFEGVKETEQPLKLEAWMISEEVW